jgi:ABC-type oligopeptide transport system ATPase subunit
MPSYTTAEAVSRSRGGAGDRAPLLSVEHLTAGFTVGGRFVAAVRDVTFAIGPGETLGLVGESGSGKTMTCLSKYPIINLYKISR